MNDGEFSVVVYYNTESWEYVLRNVTAPVAFDRWKNAVNSPAAMMGIVTKVLITDAGDFCNAHWEHGKGIVFPTPEDCSKMNHQTPI